MSRTLSTAAVRELLAQNSGEVFLVLLTLSHPSMTTLRVVSNTVNITSRGNLYTAFPFEITLPQDLSEELRPVRLSISNVDRRLIDEIRTIASPITVTMEIITAGAPNTVEVGPFAFEMASCEYNEQTITATLTYEPVLFSAFPGKTFDPQLFPGLFGRV